MDKETYKIMEWHSINEQPPDMDLEVMDEKGNIANANPTYYNFEIINKHIVQCDPYWDGCFIVECKGLECTINNIVKWRLKNKS